MDTRKQEKNMQCLAKKIRELEELLLECRGNEGMNPSDNVGET